MDSVDLSYLFEEEYEGQLVPDGQLMSLPVETSRLAFQTMTQILSVLTASSEQLQSRFHCSQSSCVVQIMDYGDLSYLMEEEYERQLVALSQDAQLMSLPVGTRNLAQGQARPC